MKLTCPTDFEILEVMSDGKRQTAPNLAAILGRDKKYMNNQLRDLAGHGLVEKVGPAERSSMYVITERGRVALDLREKYDHGRAREFAEMVDEELESRTE